MKAKNLYHLGDSRAPKEWEEIDIIKKARPAPSGQEVSLQRLDGTNICLWYTRTQVFWNPKSDFFLVEEE